MELLRFNEAVVRIQVAGALGIPHDVEAPAERIAGERAIGGRRGAAERVERTSAGG